MKHVSPFLDPYIHWAQEQRPEWFDCDLGSSGLTLEWDWAEWDIDPGEMPADGANWYGYEPLRERIAASLSLPAARVLLAPGCTGANALVLAARVRPGDRVAVETPAYSPLASAVRGFGGTVVPLERSADLAWGFAPDTLRRGLAGCTLCIITNPHNPTGRLMTQSEVEDLAGACKSAGALLLVDEVYREFPGGEQAPSAVTCCENAVITSSMTKAYGLGGFRVGWIAGPAAVVEQCMAANKVLLGRGSLAGEWLVERILANTGKWAALRRRIHDRVKAGRDLAARFVASHPELTWRAPDVGICSLVDLPPGLDGKAFTEQCRETARTYVVPGDFFGRPCAFRLSIGAGPETVAEGLKRLGRVLDGMCR